MAQNTDDGKMQTESMADIGKELDQFDEAEPEYDQHTQYNFINGVGSIFGMLGGSVNTNGTECEFEDLSERYTKDKEIEELFKTITDEDKNDFPLHEKAYDMAEIFRVNYEFFDESHDRENEIKEGLISKNLYYNELRSFAWTLAAYCDKNKISPDEIKTDTLEKLVSFINDRNCLNYRSDSYSPELCSGDDIHMYFVPESLKTSDRFKLYKMIRESEENAEDHRKYVRSLDKLREELDYLFPAIRKLYLRLKKTRKSDEALLGGISDVVYAWCSMTYAARSPFFIEDGPMNCVWGYLGNKSERIKDFTEHKSEKPETEIEKTSFPSDDKNTVGYENRITRNKFSKARLDYTQDKRYSGNGYSIGIPDTFTKVENYEDSSGENREFYAYLPNSQSKDNNLISFYYARKLPFASLQAKNFKFYSPVAEDYLFRYEQLLGAKQMQQLSPSIECYPIRTGSGYGYAILQDYIVGNDGRYFFYISVPVKDSTVMFRIDITRKAVENKEEAKQIVDTIISKLNHEYLIENYIRLDDDYYTNDLLTDEKTSRFIKTTNDLLTTTDYMRMAFNQNIQAQIELDVGSGKVNSSQRSVDNEINKHANRYIDDQVGVMEDMNRQLIGFFNKASEINKDNLLIYEIRREIAEYQNNCAVCSVTINDHEKIRKEVPNSKDLLEALNNQFLYNQDLINEADEKKKRDLEKTKEEEQRKLYTEEEINAFKAEKARVEETITQKIDQLIERIDSEFARIWPEEALNDAEEEKKKCIEEYKKELEDYCKRRFSVPVFDSEYNLLTFREPDGFSEPIPITDINMYLKKYERTVKEKKEKELSEKIPKLIKEKERIECLGKSYISRFENEIDSKVNDVGSEVFRKEMMKTKEKLLTEYSEKINKIINDRFSIPVYLRKKIESKEAEEYEELYNLLKNYGRMTPEVIVGAFEEDKNKTEHMLDELIQKGYLATVMVNGYKNIEITEQDFDKDEFNNNPREKVIAAYEEDESVKKVFPDFPDVREIVNDKRYELQKNLYDRGEKIRNKIQSLKDEYNSLGLFATKQKNAIQIKLTKLNEIYDFFTLDIHTENFDKAEEALEKAEPYL